MSDILITGRGYFSCSGGIPVLNKADADFIKLFQLPDSCFHTDIRSFFEPEFISCLNRLFQTPGRSHSCFTHRSPQRIRSFLSYNRYQILCCSCLSPILELPAGCGIIDSPYLFCQYQKTTGDPPHLQFFSRGLMDLCRNLSLTASAFFNLPSIRRLTGLNEASGELLFLEDPILHTRMSFIIASPTSLLPDTDSHFLLLSPSGLTVPQNETPLSRRESEVLHYASRGMSNRFIAAQLKISEGTVKKILYNAYQKLGISSRQQLPRIF